ncbi:putative helicase mov-10-B.1 [Electrophorus electricus]|uniref:RNA helicase n=1 Tax=Electrophorus electricus TaxID=8005 RepID=A0A4W4DY72_ELEEL|nr:putative helicase mov-10-B.1 [Electrophorus electricus]
MGKTRRNGRLSKADVRAVGLDFIEFLNESNRIDITDRDRLRDIYNAEFRRSDGAKDPNFSTVLYVLRTYNRVRVTRGRCVYFSRNVRVVLQDQWWRPCVRRKSTSHRPLNVGSFPLPPNGLEESSSPTPPGPEGGVRGRRRLAQEILHKLKSNRSEFVADKNGVQVSSELEMLDGKVCFFVDQAEVCRGSLLVENKGTSSVEFTYYSPLHWINCFKFEDSQKVTRNNPLRLDPGDKYEVSMMFRSAHVGVYQVTVAFEFKTTVRPCCQPFHIVRIIEAESRTQLAQELGPVKPFKPNRLSSCQTENFSVDEGEAPESLAKQSLEYEVPLGHYCCPPYIKDLSQFLRNHRKTSHDHIHEKKSLLEAPLAFSNYAERFHLLLHLEESQMLVDIKAYDKEDVTMKQDKLNKKLLVLQVPGVSENRPSVLRGDHLLVTKSKDVHLQNITKYKGYVHRVELDQLKLGFSSKFLASFIDKMKFRVEFTVNRVPLRLQHRAVQLAVQHQLEDVLFPVGSKATIPGSQRLLSLFDRKLEENTEQYTAVCNIVAGVSKPAPYLVFGPPGTGKTVTMVEAIKQVLKCVSGARVLACAPSNSAADQLCVRVLQHLDPREIYRLYASSRDPNQVPHNLLDVCNLKDEMYEFPCKMELMKYKILVTTLVTAGRLVTGGLPPGHFTHIFLDEAGHAVESEAIIGVAGLLQAETGQLVLAGDPKQLGPILRSPFAIKYGLALSLLERLMTQNPLYQKGDTGFNNQYVTKLLRNYRSHRSILKVPNEMFYDSELQPYADEYTTSFYCNWEHLPNKGFPVIFHGVLGKDERELNSPSFFNVSEITIVMDYLKKLLLSQGKKGIAKISPQDIGIIAPYRKQVEKLRKAIRKTDELERYTGIEDLKVGSVEEFQGQERRVIIVTTVRSNSEHISMDIQYNIGFLKNEKRFNVAMTRPRALLIVVGNPIILSSDPTWGRFIEYCTAEGGYTGFDRTTIEGTEDVVDRLMALSIRIEPEVDTEESGIQQHVNLEWRNEQ